MPNHINSQVEITGSKAKIKKLIKDVGINLDLEALENKFDFNGIVKMPSGLLTTNSPTKVFETQEEVDAENERYRTVWNNNKVAALLKSEADRRQKEYGALNWYDWSYENWGTKWNAYEVKLIDWSGTKLVVDIQTAWDTPHKIWEKLEEMGFTVRGVYYGEMEGYEYIGEGGEAFDAYIDVTIEYNNLEQGIEKEATKVAS